MKGLATLVAARVPSVHRAQTAFTLEHQRDLVPEGITYDPIDDVLYVANPGLRSFHPDHTIWPMEKLEDPAMLRIPL
jgi:hypothetical protein